MAPLVSTLFDTDMEKTTPVTTTLSRKSSKRSKAVSRKTVDFSAEPVPPVSPPRLADPVKKETTAIVRATKLEVIELDEAFIDFWSDSLLDPITATWPTFIICKFKSTVVPQLLYGPVQEGGKQKTLKWLVLEQAFTVRPAPPPSLSAVPRPESARPVSPALSTSGRNRFSFWSMSRTASSSSQSSQKGKKKERALNVGEMGEIIEEPAEQAKQEVVQLKAAPSKSKSSKAEKAQMPIEKPVEAVKQLADTSDTPDLETAAIVTGAAITDAIAGAAAAAPAAKIPEPAVEIQAEAPAPAVEEPATVSETPAAVVAESVAPAAEVSPPVTEALVISEPEAPVLDAPVEAEREAAVEEIQVQAPVSEPQPSTDAPSVVEAQETADASTDDDAAPVEASVSESQVAVPEAPSASFVAEVDESAPEPKAPTAEAIAPARGNRSKDPVLKQVSEERASAIVAEAQEPVVESVPPLATAAKEPLVAAPAEVAEVLVESNRPPLLTTYRLQQRKPPPSPTKSQLRMSKNLRLFWQQILPRHQLRLPKLPQLMLTPRRRALRKNHGLWTTPVAEVSGASQPENLSQVLVSDVPVAVELQPFKADYQAPIVEAPAAEPQPQENLSALP
ncbi:hypothetical protein JR316_0007510 [Psilocybe cubensis]|uniref:Uncharacterized protein n=3 Tax=Psilocybe cubensis TaxID=181762 RepID=A0ACB8GKU6_PSICU|nr:uncharacterized protein JR316_0013498 [Psilocybe cubensis]XP_047743786.1 hypothetical protein JR316_0011732 [Psilocybe cubensis]XP_047748533.1 hypothetical protein JR316_0007510 [Psilocybe cubensis]KAH9474225.1 hypothetical protein JR316_0013498 [Psilocybe cubensis]KAH9476161.1 hypothetical protein JR316_0011732 [Psilocybe cubensis]KAH9480908.1 hypothetical protein JR316_0007510 [Psilocybe cubensis]